MIVAEPRAWGSLLFSGCWRAFSCPPLTERIFQPLKLLNVKLDLKIPLGAKNMENVDWAASPPNECLTDRYKIVPACFAKTTQIVGFCNN